MKTPLFPAAIAILVGLGVGSTMTAAAESPRKAFGKSRSFRAEELPPGKLKTSLQSLPPEARDKAMKWLHTVDFSALDAAEHLRVDSGGIYIVCPDDHGNCDGHSHGPASPAAAINNPSATGNIAAEPGQAPAPPVAYAAVAVTSPPAYNSRPGATRHIYLDFNGVEMGSVCKY